MTLVLLALPLTATAQTSYRWTSGGADTNWNTAANWDPTSGPPGSAATDFAAFNPFGGTNTNPQLTNSPTLQSVVFAPNRLGSGWTLTQDSTQRTLTLGGSGSVGLTTTGPATYTINGPQLAGASASNTLALNVTNGSTLVLAGSSVVTANQGAVNVAGGTLRLDNSATNNNTRLLSAAANTITVNGGGIFELVGNSAGTTQNLGNLVTTNNGLGGNNVIRVTSNGALAQLNFAGTSVTGTLRAGTRATWDFQSTSGRLGDANGGQITFATIPFLGSGNLFSNAAGNTAVGFATVTDSLGKNFATYANTGDTQATGIVSVANPNQTRVTVTTATTAANLAALTSTSVAQFNAAAGTTTATGAVSAASFRITPASGATLAMSASNLSVAALMLDGANDFTISGTGVLGTGTHYFYVNDANAKLSTSMQFTNGTNAVVFVGPGTFELTGSTIQNNGTAGNNYRVTLAGGVLRGNNTQIGFSTTRGVIGLAGGVLEITNGTNGTGTAADFTRALGTTAGNVTWGAQGGAEIGSGGFSAFGANASVNVGGAATPGDLRWAAAGFVDNGYALKFGSTKSDSTLTFLNPIQLDAATQPLYVLREFNVTLGTGVAADKTVLSGVVSGASGSDFLKTGTGVLELGAANTYAGSTFVQGGTLRLGSGASINATPNILVGSGATYDVSAVTGGYTLGSASPQTLQGTGTVTGATTVASGATIRGDSGTGTGTLTTGNVTVQSGGNLFANLGASGTSSKLALTSNTLDLKTGSVLKLDDVAGFNNGSYTLATFASGDTLFANGSQTTDGQILGEYVIGTGNVNSRTVNIDVSALAGVNSGDTLTVQRTGNNLVLNFSPVPEPSLTLAVCGLMVGGVVGLRKLRRKATPDVTPAA